MASEQDWETILKGKYVSYNAEIDAYLDSLEIATSTEISVSKIYYAIRDNQEIHPNLISLYREALFGTNKEVKSRIQNRISNFRRNYK